MLILPVEMAAKLYKVWRTKCVCSLRWERLCVGSRSPEMRPRQRTAVTFSFRMNIAATFATLPGCIAVIPTGPEPLSRAAELETWEQSRCGRTVLFPARAWGCSQQIAQHADEARRRPLAAALNAHACAFKQQEYFVG